MSKLSKHGEKRARKRVGTSKKNVNKQFEDALVYGFRSDELNGNLKKWVVRETFKSGIPVKCILYNNFLYIVGNGDILITVINLPGNLQKTFTNIKSKLPSGISYEDRKKIKK